jgi:hypothetical protein
VKSQVVPRNRLVNTSGSIAHMNSCGLNQAALLKATFLETGANAGINEYEFNAFKQKSVQIEKEQRTTERLKGRDPETKLKLSKRNRPSTSDFSIFLGISWLKVCKRIQPSA